MLGMEMLVLVFVVMLMLAMFTWNGRLAQLAQEKLYSEAQVYFQAWPKFDKAADENGFSPMLTFIPQRWSIYHTNSTILLLATTTTTSTTINLRKFSAGPTATPQPAQPQPQPQPQPEEDLSGANYFGLGLLQLQKNLCLATRCRVRLRWFFLESNEVSFQMRSHFSGENQECPPTPSNKHLIEIFPVVFAAK